MTISALPQGWAAGLAGAIAPVAVFSRTPQPFRPAMAAPPRPNEGAQETPSPCARPSSLRLGWFAAALPLTVLLSLLSATKTRNYDFFWHLATGRWVVEHRAVPVTDVFSFTFPGQPWLAVPWLGDLVLYGVHYGAGMPGIVSLSVACSALTLFVLFLCARDLGTRPVAPLAILPLLAIVVQPRLSQARPETLGFVFLSLSVWLAVRFWAKPGPRILLVPALSLLWVHTHASVVVVVPVLLALLLSALAAGMPRRRVAEVAAALTMTVAIVLASRSGQETLRLGSICTHAVSPYTFNQTTEWQRPEFLNGDLWIPALLLSGSLTLGMTRIRRWLFPVFLALMGGFLASQSNRHIGPASILAFPLIVLALSHLELLLERHVHRLRVALVCFLGLGLPLAHLAVSPTRDSRLAFGFGLQEDRFPIDTAQTLLRLPHARTMNDYHLGGYLIWNRVSDGVFWDGRNITVYPDSWYRDMLHATESSPALEAEADRWNIVYGLGAYELMFGSAMMQSEHWIPIHHGLASTLFVRRKHLESVRRAGVLPLELLRAQPDAGWMTRWYEPILANPVMLSELEREIVAASAMTRNAPVLLETLAYVADARPDVSARLAGLLAGQVRP